MDDICPLCKENRHLLEAVTLSAFPTGQRIRMKHGMALNVWEDVPGTVVAGFVYGPGAYLEVDWDTPHPGWELFNVEDVECIS